MASNVIAETISLDTQVFVATGFGFKGTSFEALKNHLASGRLQLVMTEIAVNEVKTRIRQAVEKELVKQRAFINEVHALFNSGLPEVQIAITKLDPEVVAADLCAQFEAFLENAKATILDCTDLDAGEVFSWYFGGGTAFRKGGE
jgi:hypothetical protein